MQEEQHHQPGYQDGQYQVFLDCLHRVTGELGIIGHDDHLGSGRQLLVQIFDDLASRISHLDGVRVACLDDAYADAVLPVVAQYLRRILKAFPHSGNVAQVDQAAGILSRLGGRATGHHHVLNVLEAGEFAHRADGRFLATFLNGPSRKGQVVRG